MKIDASEQLEYYLESLGELGEVLINSREPKSIGKRYIKNYPRHSYGFKRCNIFN